jgi:FdhD protein
VAELPDRLRAAQRVFDRAGGLHAAGLFAEDGSLLCLREGVGRHNAVDQGGGLGAA